MGCTPKAELSRFSSQSDMEGKEHSLHPGLLSMEGECADGHQVTL